MSSFALKTLAVIAMLIDHIGYTFFPSEDLFRIIGRIAFPLFAFQVALGFKHTKDRNKYILRMLIIAIISQIPHQLLLSIYNSKFSLNVCFTFLLALLILKSLEDVKPIWSKILCLIPLFVISYFLKYEYYIYGILLVITFYYTYKNPLLMLAWVFILTNVYAAYRNSVLIFYSIVALIPIAFYNGKKGKDLKYFFYAFYPVHMLVLYLIYMFC